jgi:hypothetical protein
MRIEDIIIRHHKEYDHEKVGNIIKDLKIKFPFYHRLKEHTQFALISLYYRGNVREEFEELIQKKRWEILARLILWRKPERWLVDVSIWFNAEAVRVRKRYS